MDFLFLFINTTHMKKLFLIAVICFIGSKATGQGMGLSFSYFIPKDGYFSTPISPFSLRGIGTSFNDYVSLETGASVYIMPGMQIKDLPFESKAPLLGPAFNIMVPVQLSFTIYPKDQEFSVKGGVFGFWNMWSKLNEGNFDRAIKEHEGYDLVNSNLTYKNIPGYGWIFGLEYIVYLNQQMGISLEANLLMGDANMDLKGSYDASNGGNIVTEEVDYKDAKVDFTGLEFSIGILFNN